MQAIRLKCIPYDVESSQRTRDQNRSIEEELLFRLRER